MHDLLSSWPLAAVLITSMVLGFLVWVRRQKD